ncbi:Transposase [Phytophthora megakarya]|uniref:Transposase n=1 Tax=Phytophthora megakarya TaxID=4795 RepID=A0A225WH28_9STRA|nr:Transposase [Phytophthora megakarya]
MSLILNAEANDHVLSCGGKTVFLAAVARPLFDANGKQDNATPHCKPDDPDIATAGWTDGGNIQLDFQPRNSRECNTLDLGYFTSIQALQYQADYYNLDKLIYALKPSYVSLAPVKLDNIFITLQKVFECKLCAGGSNE